MSKYYSHEDDEYSDDEPQFQRLRKQTGKPTTLKDSRKQESKEFGRAVNKYFKQRKRYEGEGKP